MDFVDTPKKINRHVLKALLILCHEDKRGVSLDQVTEQVQKQIGESCPNLAEVVAQSLRNLCQLGVVDNVGLEKFAIGNCFLARSDDDEENAPDAPQKCDAETSTEPYVVSQASPESQVGERRFHEELKLIRQRFRGPHGLPGRKPKIGFDPYPDREPDRDEEETEWMTITREHAAAFAPTHRRSEESRDLSTSFSHCHTRFRPISSDSLLTMVMSKEGLGENKEFAQAKRNVMGKELQYKNFTESELSLALADEATSEIASRKARAELEQRFDCSYIS